MGNEGSGKNDWTRDIQSRVHNSCGIKGLELVNSIYCIYHTDLDFIRLMDFF